MTNGSRDDGMRHRLALWTAMTLYLLVGAGCVLQGVRYLRASQLMPYHVDALGQPWAELDTRVQVVLVGLLKGFGAGSLCVGLALVLLVLFPLRAGKRWALWSTAGISTLYAAALVHVTSFALLPGAVPITVSWTVLVMSAAAALVSLLVRART